MAENKKLSIMITAYNLSSYIEETLDSVLRQRTNFEYEILVGDDGSSDDTQKIVESYVKKYPDTIKLFVMDRDNDVKYDKIERASKNRINLLEHANGEYLIFLDGDDKYIDDNKLQKQVEVLDNPANSDCVACSHNCWVFWNEQHKKLINTATDIRKISSYDYWKYGMYFHSDTIMFRNIFKGKYPDYLPNDDYDDNIIAFILLKYGKIIYLPDAMVYYRQVDNSSWNSVNKVEKSIINLLDWPVENSILESFSRASVYRHLADILYVRMHYEEIDESMLDKYKNKLDKYKKSKAVDWIEYGNKSITRKFYMNMWLGWHLFLFIFVKIKKMLPKYKVN